MYNKIESSFCIGYGFIIFTKIEITSHIFLKNVQSNAMILHTKCEVFTMKCNVIFLLHTNHNKYNKMNDDCH